jgi:hypothetical protein
LTGEISAARFVEELEAYRSPAELRKYHRYFKFDEDRPGDGDQFMGVRAETMGQWVYPYTSQFLRF